ncbi:MAG: DNA polymerase III [Treponema sp.]|nr:DNA polymerase III [Treponema sp.]
MFENLLGQPAAAQLIQDIQGRTMAPAMLFSGPPASGKGTAALELGRVISCEAEEKAGWNCPCPACERHRRLLHPDLLCLGLRSFSAEISASASAFLRDSSTPSVRALFMRSCRKLLARFNPVLTEDDQRASRVSSLVSSLEEDLDEMDFLFPDQAPEGQTGEEKPASPALEALTKLVQGMTGTAYKLEAEGLGETIPIGQLRRAAYWSRLAPVGPGKLLLIENADRMQDEARNSLLKILEEPPPRLTLVLASSRPGSLLPTILSRIRPYRFSARDPAIEGDVVRRVFRDKLEEGQNISAYLESFLPVSGEMLYALAAFFAASAAARALGLARRQGLPVPEEAIKLGKLSSPIAEAAQLGRPQEQGSQVCALILQKAGSFEIRSLFSRFLSALLDQVSQSQVPPGLAFSDLWREHIAWADTAVGIYRLRSSQVLEKLFTDLSRGMAQV